MKNIEFKIKFNGVMMSFWKGTNGATIVFAPGIPQYVTSYHPFISTLLSLGYSVLVPKYKGTWESRGIFTIKGSLDSVYCALDVVSSGFAIDLYDNQSIDIPNNRAVLMGYSYGGLIALLANKKVDQKILLMPFAKLMMQEKKSFNTELLFIKRAYDRMYRFKISELIEEISQISYPATVDPMTIVFGNYDTVITNEQRQWIIEKYNPTVMAIDASHTTNLSKEQFQKILTI